MYVMIHGFRYALVYATYTRQQNVQKKGLHWKEAKN